MQHYPHQAPPPSHLQHHRPSSIVHQQHHSQAAPLPQPSHPSGYSSSHPAPPVYQQTSQGNTAQNSTQDTLPYYQASPYSTASATSGYTSADTPDMMAATMHRQYPPIYQTPQSNSPASVASPSGHDHQRSMYGQPTSQQMPQQSMYYPPQTQYGSMPQQAAPSPYSQHAQASHQSMASQPNMMMSHNPPQHQIAQHATQHAQAGLTGSPRHQKIEAHQVPPQLQRPSAPGPIGGPSPTTQNGGQLSTPTGSTPGGVNPNAAPGPIPATTPLVVRQDGNGVQWIAFEYSRDRVKMEYTIRCDVESVDTDQLSAEFKTENCVYPRACCPKDQYRGNRLQYETECNTVGWALAQLNPPLRGKRGLIQRAVDSWRNSNQDPRLRSRRVRRMAKMGHRKSVNNTHPAHMAGPSGPAGMPASGPIGPSGSASMGKPGMTMGGQMHHHQGTADGHAHGAGDEVGDGDYMDDQHHHHHQAPATQGAAAGDDVRQTHVFNSGYGNYGSNAPAASSSMPSLQDTLSNGHHPVAARRANSRAPGIDEPENLFPDIPEAKKRKFILVEDSDRQSRLRVRVTLDGVDTREIPDSFRKSSSVYPRSYFPREMQSPPPSATGSRFFQDDMSDAEDDGNAETEGRRAGRGVGGRGRSMVKVPATSTEGGEVEVAIPKLRRGFRGKEVRLNDLGYRMAWLQSRVFAGRPVFLQRALDCYRNKTRQAIDSIMQDVKTVAPHYETRVGKRRWTEKTRRADKKDDEA
ncbi:hypothetical protein VP1G_08056 [Cytospora mali]|uniref:DUF8032 domain-containing protein n=1 Tax=Cytospora mali TaxID=578113 RepID=A0A194VAF7_CYTMA|nr:hypothetical protein VP1G_08056 [Valsa mali var. pyri (nom. inval.)]